MRWLIHIGIEKTGTTSIQACLGSNRRTLLNRGILHPELLGSPNHMELAVACMDTVPGDELQAAELSRTGLDHEAYRTLIAETLRTEADEAGCETVVLSNEHLHSRLCKRSEVERLQRLLVGSAGGVEVIAYLRRQDRLALSLHSTRVRLGGQGPMFPAAEQAGHLEYYRFDRLLERYRELFGRSSITVRLFEDCVQSAGDIVQDFLTAAGIGDLPLRSARENAALSWQQIGFLELFNERFPLMVDGKVNAERFGIVEAIHHVHARGGAVTCARDRARRFCDLFRESNALVREEYFPGLSRETLFDEDFSAYPLEDPIGQVSTEVLMDFVEGIWRYCRRDR